MNPGVRIVGVALVVAGLAACTPQGTRSDSERSPADINVQLGKAYIQDGNLEKALGKLEKALDQDPDNALAHAVMAQLRKLLGEPDKAAEEYERAVRLAPKDPSIRNNYGAFLCDQGQLDAADEQFMIAATDPLYRAPEFAYTNAALCAWKEPDLEKAEKYFRAALRKNPKFAPALYHMARLSLEQENYLQGRAYVQRYFAVAPVSPASLWLAIRIEKNLGDENAVSNYGLRLKSKFPDSEETRLLREMEKDERRAES